MFWLTFRFCFISPYTLLPYVSSRRRDTLIRNENCSMVIVQCVKYWSAMLSKYPSLYSLLLNVSQSHWPISFVLLVLICPTCRGWLPRTLRSHLGFSRQRRWLEIIFAFLSLCVQGFLAVRSKPKMLSFSGNFMGVIKFLVWKRLPTVVNCGNDVTLD